jgi:hypothetical protein
MLSDGRGKAGEVAVPDHALSHIRRVGDIGGMHAEA